MKYLSALLLLVSGCTESMDLHEEVTASIARPDPPIAAVAPLTLTRTARPATRDPGPGGAPMLRRVQATYDATTLALSASYPPGFDYDRYLDPTRIGGWTFEVFVDTDQDPATGYSRGYEFVVCGAELLADTAPIRRTLRVRPAWGLRTGEAKLERTKRGLAIRVPLSALSDDGAVAWELHTYQGSPTGPPDSFAASYEGVSTPR